MNPRVSDSSAADDRYRHPSDATSRPLTVPRPAASGKENPADYRFLQVAFYTKRRHQVRDPVHPPDGAAPLALVEWTNVSRPVKPDRRSVLVFRGRPRLIRSEHVGAKPQHVLTTSASTATAATRRWVGGAFRGTIPSMDRSRGRN